MVCHFCGSRFEPYKYGDGRQKFCSSLCREKSWHKKNPEQAKAIRIKTKAKNRDKLREYGRKYYAEHKEEMRIKLLAWRRANKARVVQQVLDRNAKRRGNGGSHTLQEWRDLQEKYGHRCAFCKRETDLTRDHIVPVSKGGTDDISNIQPLCRPCNSRKFNH